jgi:hypothetical protein
LCKSDLAQTSSCWHKVIPFDGTNKQDIQRNSRVAGLILIEAKNVSDEMLWRKMKHTHFRIQAYFAAFEIIKQAEYL